MYLYTKTPIGWDIKDDGVRCKNGLPQEVKKVQPKHKDGMGKFYGVSE